MTTYSNLKYNHSLSANATGTGSLNLISSQTASGSANINFTSGIDSTYKEYIFKLINIHPATDNTHVQFNLSVDSGSNYNVTKTTTNFATYHNEADNNNALSYESGNDLAQGTGVQILLNEIGADNDQSASSLMHLFDPSNTTFVKHFISRTIGVSHHDYQRTMFVAGYGNTTSAVNAVQFSMSSGNIDTGTILMYGVK